MYNSAFFAASFCSIALIFYGGRIKEVKCADRSMGLIAGVSYCC
jgi:hypothetical protein